MRRETNNKTGRLQRKNPGLWLAVGITIGAGVGVALKNIALGVGLGVAFGCVLNALRRPKNRLRDLRRNHQNDSILGKASEPQNPFTRRDNTPFYRWRSRNAPILP